jgi:hypothetical protein
MCFDSDQDLRSNVGNALFVDSSVSPEQGRLTVAEVDIRSSVYQSIDVFVGLDWENGPGL